MPKRVASELERCNIRVEINISYVDKVDFEQAAQNMGISLATWIKYAARQHVRPGSNPGLTRVEKATHEVSDPVLTRVRPGSENIHPPLDPGPPKQLKKQPVATQALDPGPKNTQPSAHVTAHVERERARAGADLRKRDLPKQQVGSSLRSEQAQPAAQAAAVLPEPQPEKLPWQTPTPQKQRVKLSTGESVDNMYLFANGTRIPGPDVERILTTPLFTHLRAAMLVCFARSLRDTFRSKWCEFNSKPKNAWMDTDVSNKAFKQGALYLAQEYAKRNMLASEFIDACNEMRPKTIKFVTANLLGNAIGARVADWIPPEQRERNKSLTTHEDAEGRAWITPEGEEPMQVIRTAAERQAFLKTLGLG